ECSSHAVLDAAIGGFKDSERIVSDALDAHVGTGTLLLADRGLWGLARWHRLRDQGTHLLWRIERRKARRVQDVMPDGSYLARIEANKHSKAAGTVKAPPAFKLGRHLAGPRPLTAPTSAPLATGMDLMATSPDSRRPPTWASQWPLTVPRRQRAAGARRWSVEAIEGNSVADGSYGEDGDLTGKTRSACRHTAPLMSPLRQEYVTIPPTDCPLG
ncbi:hypothetical protein ACTU45_32525, partial [Streptomyces sp. 24-1644]